MSLDKEEIKKRIIERLQNNPIIGHACRNAGVARSSLYRFREEDPVFDGAVKNAQRIGRAVTCDAAESKILNLINSNDEAIALKASKIILNTYNYHYHNNHAGVNYQKALVRDEVEMMKKEKQELINGYSESLRIMMESQWDNEDLSDKEVMLELKDNIEQTLKKMRNANKNIQEDDERESLRGLI